MQEEKRMRRLTNRFKNLTDAPIQEQAQITIQENAPKVKTGASQWFDLNKLQACLDVWKKLN